MASEALEQRFADLQGRLTALQDATSQLKELIDRLANFNFQPGSVPLGAADDDNVGAELSTEINQFLREQEEELELLDEEIVDSRPGKSTRGELQHEKDRLKDGAQRLKGELQRCRATFRKAQLAARRNLQLAQRQERELLYASFAAPRSGASSPLPTHQPRRKQQISSEMSKEEQAVNASNDVTRALRRTHDMMASELSRSDFAHRTLKESTAALSSLSETYSSLDSMLSKSRDLLGTLMKSQKSDTWYLETAFTMLLFTIGWLIFRRWLYGPAWWLVWLPMKLLFRGAVGVSRGVGLHGGSEDLKLESSGTGPGSQSAQMNNEGVPTIKVSNEKAHSQGAKDPESLMDKVGEIIDDAKARPLEDIEEATAESETRDQDTKDETVLRDREEHEYPNPKKRVLEEDAGAQRDSERTKDEL